MDVSRVELSVGDSIRLDDQILTVMDIHGEEITFRIDPVADCELSSPFSDSGSAQRPPR